MSDEWWDAVRPRFTPFVASEAMSADAVEAALRARLAPFFDDVTTRVAIPEGFRRHLARVRDTSWYGRRIAWDFIVFSARGVVETLDDAVEVWGGEDVYEGVRAGGAWVEFAHQGDHWATFVCCDTTMEEFGRVGHGEDTHPWLAGAGVLAPLVTFDAWERSIRERRTRALAPVMVALDEACDATITSLLARADAREAVCAVRELVDRLVPDSAWSRTWTAAEWALLLRRESALEPSLRASGADLVVDHRGVVARRLPAAAIARWNPPALPAWSALAWDATRREMRAVEAADALVAAFAERAREAGRALLWVEEDGGP